MAKLLLIGYSSQKLQVESQIQEYQFRLMHKGRPQSRTAFME